MQATAALQSTVPPPSLGDWLRSVCNIGSCTEGRGTWSSSVTGQQLSQWEFALPEEYHFEVPEGWQGAGNHGRRLPLEHLEDAPSHQPLTSCVAIALKGTLPTSPLQNRANALVPVQEDVLYADFPVLVSEQCIVKPFA